MSVHLPRLGDDADAPFPPIDTALRRPDGLLAFGGDLSVQRLRNAYRHGVFPWYSDGQPILWWAPDPRGVFRTGTFHLPTRFRRSLRTSRWTVRADTAFETVIRACADMPRPRQDGTWISEDMVQAYLALHAAGDAHSIEVHDGDRLVGALYGVAAGRMFFGESMVSFESGGSKVALAALAHRLAAWDWPLIDAQMENDHLRTLGVEAWPRARFAEAIAPLVDAGGRPGPWTDAFGTLPATQLSDRPGQRDFGEGSRGMP